MTTTPINVTNGPKSPVVLPAAPSNPGNPGGTDPMDAMEAAMVERPQSLERTYFGQVAIVDAYFCTLQKGVGKQPFDASRDDPRQKRTAIRLQVAVQKRDGTEYTIDQDTIDTGKEWQKFTLPSLRTLNLTLRGLQNQWVQVKRQPIGETYVSKVDSGIKDKTAFVFVEVYPDQDACKAAAEAFYQAAAGTGATQPPVPAADAAPTAPADENPAERAFAAQSLPLLWQAAGKKPQAFFDMIKQNPMISKYFDGASPEVMALVGEDLPF